MNLSLGEFQDLARKASRGVGFAWGEADEIGQAARWLAAQQQPAGEALAVLLTQVDAGLPAERCPIRLGCRFADHVLKVTEAPQEHSNLVAPLFLLPFLSWALSSAAAGAIEIDETKGSALSGLNPQGLSEQTGSWPEIASVRLRLVSVNALPKPYPTAKRIDLHPSDQITLAAFATRTLAPETEERRRFGAGGREA